MLYANVSRALLPILLLLSTAVAQASSCNPYPAVITNSGAPGKRETALFLRILSFSGSAYDGRNIQLRTNASAAGVFAGVVDASSPVLKYFIRNGTIYSQDSNESSGYHNAGPVAGLQTVSSSTSSKGNSTKQALIFRNDTTAAGTAFRKSVPGWQLFSVTDDGTYQLYHHEKDEVVNGFVVCDVAGGISVRGGYGQLFYYLYTGNPPMPAGCENIAVQSVVAPVVD